MWQPKIESLQANRVQKYAISLNKQQLTYKTVIDLWQNDPSFCVFFNSLLADSSFDAYFWETPPINLRTIETKFEFVLIDNPSLDRLNPNPNPFKKYFISAKTEQNIVTFPNLNKDATLIVPRPLAKNSAYTHIANFVRKAPHSQQIALWKSVGKTLTQKLTDRFIWVSTSGLGVYWLHIRLDSYPKYYVFQPYK